MILDIGEYVDNTTGEVRPRKLIFGRAVKNAEVKAVGSRGTSMLTICVSPGREEDLVTIKMWGYDADDYADLKKGTVLLVDAKEESREFNGKIYRDYVPLNIIQIHEEKKQHKKSKKTVEPENPFEGFTDIQNNEELPF